jgi:hypothetical protein
MLSFNIPYPYLIKFPYFADTIERGVWGWKEVERQDEDQCWAGITNIPGIIRVSLGHLSPQGITMSDTLIENWTIGSHLCENQMLELVFF